MKKDLRKKYFGVGFNKTATTTLHSLFKYNGVPSWHDVQSEWDTDKYCAFFDGRKAVGCPINGVSPDSEISIPSIKKYLKYPASIFILQTRPLDDWLISRFKHGHSRTRATKKNHNFWPPSTELARRWISARQKHHMNVLEFFRDMSEKLIIVDISKQNWMDWLCGCLEFKKNPPNIKNNARSVERNIAERIMNIVNTTFDGLGYDQEQQKQSLVDSSTDIKNLIKNYKNNL